MKASSRTTAAAVVRDAAKESSGEEVLGDFIVINVTDENINLKYVYWTLKYYKDYINDVAYIGSGLKHLNKKILLNFKIPLPPLDIQTRIVEQLDNIYENEIAGLAATESYKLI